MREAGPPPQRASPSRNQLFRHPMFGRGRGRGAPPPGARLRDDDGNHIALNTHAAPPELFPVRRMPALHCCVLRARHRATGAHSEHYALPQPIGRPLPPLPALTARDEDLLARKRQLDAHWRSSCFNLPLPSATPGGASHVAAVTCPSP